MREIGGFLWVDNHKVFDGFGELPGIQCMCNGRDQCPESISTLLMRDPNSTPNGVNDRWTVKSCDACFRDFLVVPGVFWGPPLCYRCLTPGQKKSRRKTLHLCVSWLGDPYIDASNAGMLAYTLQKRTGANRAFA